ncbi:hypothetical protein J5N97_029183 [Dioscorea zingiberensis]|uniref:BZIP domain-containing protein n=1 Tax=Dioscorea zingiberensis TaxID=325984 RepID=A0A9D5C0B5_9LILI|nr:hypothetical protein J5N97_029183 [Dioscorea zingiberensis]
MWPPKQHKNTTNKVISSSASSSSPKNMEEVWKDITLTNITTSHQTPLLQDFLSGSFKPPPPPSNNSGTSKNAAIDVNSINGNMGLLYTVAGFQLSFNKPGLEMKTYDQQQPNNGGRADRRRKRMIKNRESAARSRARKKAYTEELELEVAELVKENEKLRREHAEMRLRMTGQFPIKATLQRCATAPF